MREEWMKEQQHALPALPLPDLPGTNPDKPITSCVTDSTVLDTPASQVILPSYSSIAGSAAKKESSNASRFKSSVASQVSVNISSEPQGEGVPWQTKIRSRKRKVVIRGKALGREHMAADNVRHIEVFISRLNPATTTEDVESRGICCIGRCCEI